MKDDAANTRSLELNLGITEKQAIPSNPEGGSHEEKLLQAEIIRRFVSLTMVPAAETWLVGNTGRRTGQIGRAVAIIGFKHAPGYEIVLRFSDGKMASFTPFDLYPDPARLVARTATESSEEDADE